MKSVSAKSAAELLKVRKLAKLESLQASHCSTDYPEMPCRMAGPFLMSGQRVNSHGYAQAHRDTRAADACFVLDAHDPSSSTDIVKDGRQRLAHLQAAVKGAKHVPLYLRDEEKSPGALIKQVQPCTSRKRTASPSWSTCMLASSVRPCPVPAEYPAAPHQQG